MCIQRGQTLQNSGRGPFQVSPNGARIELWNDLVGGDEPCEAVCFGIGDDEAVERVAGPFFIQGGAGNG